MRLAFAHCPDAKCPSADVPDDAGTIGARRFVMQTWEHQWQAGPKPRCGFCGGILVRNAGNDRGGRSTADARNTWRTYTTAAGTKCSVRQLVSGDPDSDAAVWTDWKDHTAKSAHTFTKRVRARAGYWTFRLEHGGRVCEIEFSQLEIEVAR